MNLKSQKGSITLFVLVSCLFFLASVVSVNMYMQSKQSAVDKEYRQVKANYEKDINNMNSIYAELLGKNNLSVNFAIPEINQTNKKISVDIYLNLEYLNIKTLKYGWYYSNEEVNTNYLQSNNVINWTYVENQNGENEFVASTNFTQNNGYYYLCVMIDNQEIWFDYPINISKTKFTSFYGEYVDYDKDLGIRLDSNLQTESNSQSDLNYDWKIFYQDEDTVYIIAKDYVKWENVTTQQNLGNQRVNNNPYALFWESGSNIPKTGAIDIFFGDNEFNKKLANKYLYNWKSIMMPNNDISSLENNTNINAKITALMMDTSVWRSITINNSNIYAIGCPTIEMWVNSWNDIYENDKIYISNDENAIGYKIGDLNSINLDYNVVNMDGYDNKLFFPHKNPVSKCYGYCIASPSSRSNDLLMRVDYDGFIGNKGGYLQHGALRPVVCIPSNIKILWNSNDKIWHIIY